VVPGSANNKYIAAGARYNFGAFAVNVGAGRNDPFGAANNTKSIWGGGDAQVGPGRLHLQLGLIDPDGAAKATSLGVTYNYPLSKRTNAYVTAGVVQNNASSAAGLSTSSTGVSAGGLNGDPKGISFGVGHNF
jgi:predicted porin